MNIIKTNNQTNDSGNTIPKKMPQDIPIKDEVLLSNDKNPADIKKWTFLHYGAGDNDLFDVIYNDVDEMESVGSDINTNLLSQLDSPNLIGTCKRYFLEKDGKKGINSKPVQDLGANVNMADPKTLTDFIVWGFSNYPSQNLAVVISDHGGGTDGAIADDTSNTLGMMKPQDIQKALSDAQLKTGKKIDVLGFDCCLMANAEVAYQLKDTADFLVASEESEGENGWPYNKMLSEKHLKELQEKLKNKINVTPRQLAVKVVKDSIGFQGDLPTLSSIDMGKMNYLAQNIDKFAKSILETKTPMDEFKLIIGETQEFDRFRDIYDFAKRVTLDESINDLNLKNSAKELMIALNTAIIAEQHSHSYPGAKGLQVILDNIAKPNNYNDFALAKDTNWDEAIERIAKG